MLLKEAETLIPASRINSNEISINNISKITGKGMVSLELPIAKSNSDGISS